MTTELIRKFPTPEELTTFHVLDEVFKERQRQDKRWGQQNHPWTETKAPWSWLHRIQGADHMKRMVEGEAEIGHLNYSEILYEEVLEALEEEDLARVREELIQVAAVAVAAIESIDRNGR